MSATAGAAAAGADVLPGAGDDGFFGIRFESIGGLGAHLAGQILAEAGVLRQGLNGSHLSSYGSEKKGTPVKSFVRFCPAGHEVRTSSPIERPQLVAVFHQALAQSFDVAAGLGPGGTLIMNTRAMPGQVPARRDEGRAGLLPAELEDRGPGRPGDRPGRRRFVLLPPLRDRAERDPDHLRRSKPRWSAAGSGSRPRTSTHCCERPWTAPHGSSASVT
jgi:hypothetical protein